MTLTKGRHEFPFSILLEGHLPATMDSSILSVNYEFKSVLTPAGPSAKPIKLERRLQVSRSIPPKETPHHSVRVFPPTKITAAASYPQVMHPTGVEKLTLRLDGLTNKNASLHGQVEVWKLKRVKWSVEETIRTVAPACVKHSPPNPKDAPQPAESQKKGMLRIDTKILASDEMTKGWKSDYDAGSIDLEVDYSAATSTHLHFGLGALACCDGRSRDGTEVTHSLAVELVVVQEAANLPRYATSTGSARVLRMHFAAVVPARGGLGVSWDNEMPPIYQDVPPSPPKYPVDKSSVAPGSPDAVGEVLDMPVPYDQLEGLDAQRPSLSLEDLDVSGPVDERGEGSGANPA